MIRQHVNFYQDELFKQKKAPLCIEHMMLVWGIGLLLVVVLLGAELLDMRAMNKELSVAEQQLEQMRKQHQAVQKQFPERTQIAKLKKELASMESYLRAKRRLVKAMSEKTSSNLKGFSRHVEGLARQVVPGLWLSDIILGEGGMVVSLRGETHQPALVFQYLNNLSDDPIFAHTNFSAYMLNRKEQQNAGQRALAETVNFAFSTGDIEDVFADRDVRNEEDE